MDDADAQLRMIGIANCRELSEAGGLTTIESRDGAGSDERGVSPLSGEMTRLIEPAAKNGSSFAEHQSPVVSLQTPLWPTSKIEIDEFSY